MEVHTFRIVVCVAKNAYFLFYSERVNERMNTINSFWVGVFQACPRLQQNTLELRGLYIHPSLTYVVKDNKNIHVSSLKVTVLNTDTSSSI